MKLTFIAKPTESQLIELTKKIIIAGKGRDRSANQLAKDIVADAVADWPNLKDSTSQLVAAIQSAVTIRYWDGEAYQSFVGVCTWSEAGRTSGPEYEVKYATTTGTLAGVKHTDHGDLMTRIVK